MEVELGGSLLTAQGPDILLLLSICAFGFMGRHRIVSSRTIEPSGSNGPSNYPRI